MCRYAYVMAVRSCYTKSDAARQNQALVADYNSAPAAIFGCNVQIAEIIFMTASDSQIIHLYISSLISTEIML